MRRYHRQGLVAESLMGTDFVLECHGPTKAKRAQHHRHALLDEESAHLFAGETKIRDHARLDHLT